MPDPEWKTGDTYPPIRGTVTDDSAAAVDISGAASIRFIAKSGANVIAGTATILDVGVPTRGRWEYEWASDDLAAAGSYEAEIEVTWGVGDIETFPSNEANNPTFPVTADND